VNSSNPWIVAAMLECDAPNNGTDDCGGNPSDYEYSQEE
jgi:hypothetical protein